MSENLSPSYEINDLDGTTNPQVNQESGGLFFCCYRLQNNQTNISNSKWKKLMIEQLESLEIEGWPKLLSKCLKNQPMGELDRFYQNDIILANKQSSNILKKSFSVQSVLSQHRDEASFVVDSNLGKEESSSQSFIKNLENRQQDEAVQELLDSSHIFEEQFYHDNNKETWLNKTFDIKLQNNSVLDDSLKHRPQRIITNPPKKVKKYTTKHIEKYKNNTFVNQLPKNESNADSLLQNVLRYKLVTQRIERQANQKRNVFCQMKDRFQSYFTEVYGPVLEKANRGEIAKGQIKVHSFHATADLQQFIRIFFEGLCSFYQLDSLEVVDGGQSSGKELLFNRDNLLSFTTSLIFTEEIYDIIFGFYKLEEAGQEDSYQSKVQLCKDLQPQDFGVPEEYALNEKTVAYFIEKGKLAKPVPAAIPDVIQEEDNVANTEEENKVQESSMQDSVNLNRTSLNSRKSLDAYHALAQETQPYEEAITLISNLKHRKSPIHKLKTIVRVAELITKGIERFYAKFGLMNTHKLDADQTLSIFLYIVTKSGIGHLNSHCKIIEKFSTNNVLNSVSGYYATTLEACVNCISNMDFSDKEKTPDRISVGFKEFVHSMKMSTVERFSIIHKDGI